MKVLDGGATPPVGRVVGIDLGTTHSLVAVFEDGRPRVLVNELGRTLVPSAVAVTEDGHLLVGDPALERLVRRPGDGVARFKPNMGTNTSYRLGAHDLTPVGLSAMILREMRAIAEAALGAPVTRAVVTVPAWFREPQRKATVEAAALAGLEVSRVLNEPTAAAIAHGLHKLDHEAITVVLDLGGGTFDVTVLDLFEGVVEVLASVGDTHLGGEDFTDALLEHALDALGEGVELSSERRAQLRHRAELAKRGLGTKEVVELEIPDPRADGWVAKDTLRIDRSTFDRLNAPRIERVRACVREALVQAGKAASDVDEVLLVGGATRMPSVHALAEEVFARTPRVDADVDEVVVCGAAVQTALLERHEGVRDFVVTDVTPHSLGIAISREYRGTPVDDQFDAILHRGTTIPVSRERSYSTVHARQEAVVLEVYQGEHRRASRNQYLGQLLVDGLPTGRDPEHRYEVRVRFTHDANGLLEVEATVPATDKQVRTVIERQPGQLPEEARRRAVEALEALKTPPRELLPNRYALERAQRVFEGLRPEHKAWLDAPLLRFEAALAEEEPKEITASRLALISATDRICRIVGLEG